MGSFQIPVIIHSPPNNNADTIVDESFTKSQSYASEAWTKALELIDKLKEIKDFSVNLSEIPTIDLVNPSYETVAALAPQAPNVSVVVPAAPDVSGMEYQNSGIYAVLNERIIAELESVFVTGGTGLHEDVETALWARARRRTEKEYGDKIIELENQYASRGHSLPPGAMVGMILELGREQSEKLADSSNEIAVKQAELAQKNRDFAVEVGQKHVAMEKEDEGRRSIFLAQKFDMLVKMYSASVEAADKLAQAYVELFKGQVAAYSAKIEGIKADILAQIEIAKAQIEQVKIMSEIAIKSAELTVTAATSGHGLQSEAIKSAAAITAQLAASAMSSVHASAQVGKSLSDNYSKAYSLSRSEQYEESQADITQTNVSG